MPIEDDHGKSIPLLNRFLCHLNLNLFPAFVLNVEIGFSEREFDRAIHGEGGPLVTGAGPYHLIPGFDRITAEEAAPLGAVFDEWAP